jgi:surface polysaccharide O-acyltransferase-like enzyme
MTILLEMFGWIGTFLIVYAYYKNNQKKSKFDKKSYFYLNIFGSSLISLNVFDKGAYPALFLQVIWIGISLKSLLNK